MKKPASTGSAAFALLLALLVPGRADACESAEFEEALVHSALPTPLPRGTIIADIVFENTDERRLHQAGIRVRIRRPIQGDVPGATMIVRQRILSSCSNPFANGSSGLIVAIPVETKAGETLVAPIDVSRGSGLRLRDGFQRGAVRG